MEHDKLAFALLPQKATMEEVHTYLSEIKKIFPDARTFVSTLQIKPDSTDPRVKGNPLITWADARNERQDLAARAYILLAVARTFGVDYLIFNTGIKRYAADAVCDFINNTRENYGLADIVIGEPPILTGMPSEEQLKILKNPRTRNRLLVDLLINFIISKSLARGSGNFKLKNWNAGVFMIRAAPVSQNHASEVLRTLSSVPHYEDSSLVCSQIAWHLAVNGHEVKFLPIGKINLEGLGFNLNKALSEINYIMTMIECRMGGCCVSLRKCISDLFAEEGNFNRWLKPKDEDWFFDVIVSGLEKIGRRA